MENLDEAFSKWCDSSGFERFKIEYPVMFDGVPGVAATETIYDGDIVLKVPVEYLLSIDKAKATPELQAIYENYPIFQKEHNEDWDICVLLVFLLFEIQKGTESKWKPWIDKLPQNDYTFWHVSDEIIAESLCTNFIKKSEQFKIQTESTYQQFREIIDNSKEVFHQENLLTRKSFDALYFVMISRCFGESLNNASMMPMGDNFNHISENEETCEYQTEGEYVVFKNSMGRDIEKGEQVFISYGRWSNLNLIQNYGFALENNRKDCLEADLDFGSKSAIFKNHKISNCLLVHCRMTALYELGYIQNDRPGDEIDYAKIKSQYKLHKPVNLKIEIMSLEKYQEFVKNLPQHDFLEDCKNPDDQFSKMIQIYRLGQKQIAISQIELVKTFLSNLQTIQDLKTRPNYQELKGIFEKFEQPESMDNPHNAMYLKQVLDLFK